MSDLAASGGGAWWVVAVVARRAPAGPPHRRRQLLYEHGGGDLLLDGEYGPVRLGELLPAAFGPEDVRARGPVSHHAVDVIRAKRDGRELSDAQIHWLIEGYICGEVAPEQASAPLMAIVWQGMTPRELDSWTDAMIRSGTRLDLSTVPLPTVDKHSTGGVGDKVSLPLCPLVAACGAAVPQLSAAGSATPAAPSTSWRRSPASARTWPRRRWSPSSATWEPSFAPPARTWRRPTASCTRCAT